jgi:ferredoxin/flavodoxin---NADP+ reductase
VPLIATGFGEAATAVNNAAAIVLTDAGVDPGHSSDTQPRLLEGSAPCSS